MPLSEVRRTAAMTVLTVIAGAVDAVSFLMPGKVFRALVTGNVQFRRSRRRARGRAGGAGCRGVRDGRRGGGLTLTALDARGRPGSWRGRRGGAADRRGLGGTRPARPREGRRPHRLRGGRRGGPGGGATGVHRAAHACARRAALLSRTALAESVDDLLHRPSR
ncbi:DUF1275 family protein [Streptomyces thermocarboxydus]